MFSLTRWSGRVHAQFLVLRATQVPLESDLVLEYGAVTLYGPTFQLCFTNQVSIFFSNILKQRIAPLFGDASSGPTTLLGKPSSLGFSAFARRYLRNLFEFFSSGYLDVSVHQVPLHGAMNSLRDGTTLLVPDFSIRAPSDQHSCAAPRGVSPLTRPSSASCP